MYKRISFAAVVLALAFPAHATVTGSQPPAAYACTGSATVFTVPFPYLAKADLLVTQTTTAGVVTTLTQPGGYSVTPSVAPSTGTVTLAVACPSGSTLRISRNMSFLQPQSFRTGNYQGAVHEQAFDRLEMQIQQINATTASATKTGLLSAADWIRFNATAFTSLNQFQQLGTGAITRTIGEKLGDLISVKDYGAKGDGVTNDTAAIQAALTYACAGARSVYIPEGVYVVATTLTACTGIRVSGAGSASSILQPTISDGSPVINFPASSGFFKLQDFAILSTINLTTFSTGGISAQNCTGIRMQANTTRFEMDNVRTRGLKIGFDVTGFIITGNNVWAEYNEVGFKGSVLNSVDLNLRFENNRQDFAITASSAVLLRQLLAEGVASPYVASTIDSSNGVTLLTPYFESAGTAPRTVPFLTVGGSAKVTQFRMTGAHVAGSGGMATGVYPIALDNVDGADVNGNFADGSQTRKVSTTANTKDYRFSGTSDFDWHMDGSRQLGPAFNYWPNRQFDLWFRGWSAVTFTRSTFSKETTTVRKGANALRVSATAAQSQNHVDIQITGPAVTALRSKTVRLGAWIFVPNLTEYNEASRTALPGIIAESYNGTVVVQSAVKNGAAGRNDWNFFYAEVAMQSDATRFDAVFFPNESGTNATGNEYLIVGSVTLVESTVPLSRQMMDDLPDSPLIQSVGVNGLLTSAGTAPPTDVNQTYVAGDLVRNSAPVAGGAPGWVCTTAGSPGTWKAMGNLAP